jgi:Aspartyl protease
MAIVARNLLLLICLSGTVAPEIARGMAPATVHLLRSQTHLLIVSARINGRGPYKFILDTGSNITLIESSLFRELGLKERGRPSAKVIDWMALGKLAIADEISIEGGPSKSDMWVLEVDGIKRPDIDPSVKGVLGENFLSGFDLLIDNRRREITFDDGNSLAPTIAGERLPLALCSNVGGVQVKDRPLVSVRVPSVDVDRPLSFLLDTGSEGVSVFARNEIGSKTASTPSASNRGTAFLNDKSTCLHWRDRLKLGSKSTSRIRLTSCLKSPGYAPDIDGTLPTFIFDRIFIGHLSGFLILGPVDLPRPDKHSQP